MRWQLSEEQDAYQQSFGAWLADVAPREAVRRWLDDGDAAEFAGRLVLDGQELIHAGTPGLVDDMDVGGMPVEANGLCTRTSPAIDSGTP